MKNRAKQKNIKTSEKKQPLNEVSKHSSFKKLYKYDEIPKFLKSSPLITDGYRPEIRDTCACAGSIFQLHNETLNIWTHLIPAIIYPLHLISEYQKYQQMTSKFFP